MEPSSGLQSVNFYVHYPSLGLMTAPKRKLKFVRKHGRGWGIYTIYRALNVIDLKQESGHWYMVFVDSTSAIEMI